MDTINFDKRRKFFFAKGIVMDLPISMHAKIVYYYLCSAHDGNPSAMPQLNEIVRKCSLKDKKTAKKALSDLMLAGLLDCAMVQQQITYTIFDEPKKSVQRKYKESRETSILNNLK